MPASIDDQVLDFYAELFEQIFSKPFRERIAERRKLNVVIRQVEEVADAASASLTRFCLNQQLSEATVEQILAEFAAIADFLELENIANPNVSTEEIVENLLKRLPCPKSLHSTHDAVYRLALYTVVQVLMLVGPVMAEWQKLSFSNTFELPRRVVNRLNQISSQIDAQGRSGQSGADENYELLYRDYLLQRFHRVEAGTVRMTTNLDVDLRELFVMPRVAVRRPKSGEGADGVISLMDLSSARELFDDRSDDDEPTHEADQPPTAFEQVNLSSRLAIVGLPGAGKSTFFEWLQVKVAGGEEPFILDDQQAIPLLLRVRQLDLLNLPKGAALIEKATASRERADVMPKGWIDRQMKAGRVLFMLDGLDETEPELRDQYLIPWLFNLIKKYPKCHYLISSRPVGYPPGLLNSRKFVECDLLDFDDDQIQTYTRHWCTSVRLARNESATEARREGERDGDHIVEGFREHPYIRNLARNPLMLSAICLVNYFEGGRLPDDRALLYRLCVEGLLHNWDHRRGIRSEFSFDEKLRACREVALAMQADDRAECDAATVQEIFATVLNDSERAAKLLQYIRYRTGLLLERRPDVFGFAHLTFQEYLAALAVHEGNRLGIHAQQLVREHDDGRWKEVIALYCGVTTTPAARQLIEQLIEQPETGSVAGVLTDAYLSAGLELAQDEDLRRRVLERVAIAPISSAAQPLTRFPRQQVAPIANALIGTHKNRSNLSQSFAWFFEFPETLEVATLVKRLQAWREMEPLQIAELIHWTHRLASDDELAQIAENQHLYTLAVPLPDSADVSPSQAEFALFGLSWREVSDLPTIEGSQKGFQAVLRLIMQTLLSSEQLTDVTLLPLEKFVEVLPKASLCWSNDTKREFAPLARQFATHIKLCKAVSSGEPDSFVSRSRKLGVEALFAWANLLEGVNPKEDLPPQDSTTKRRVNRSKSEKR